MPPSDDDGPADTVLPTGLRVALDRRARSMDDGAVLLGGAPPRMLTLAPAARVLLDDGGAFAVSGPTERALARRLLDVGIAHPVGGVAGPGAHEVTVVVPVKDRVDGLARLRAALPAEATVIVVDDGSSDPAAIRAAAGDARVLRHPVARGPAAARNAGLAAADTPLVVFLDSDVVPEPGWLAPLLAVFADPAVGLAAPRITALPPVTGWLGRYEAVHSSLDLGPDPALVVPRSRVAYVPSAALLVRRDAVGGGFDEEMHVAEDVDLVLRMHAAGWRLRYVPGSRVAHDHRTRVRAWWLRKRDYGTGAAPLALRHKGSVPPMVLSPTSAAVAVLLLLARPWSAVAALGVGAVAVGRLAPRLGVRRPRSTAARLVGLGAVGAVSQTADAVTRHYWPLSLAACLVSRRARRTVLAVAVVEGLADFRRHRDRDPHVRPRLLPHVVAHRLDDLAYGTGLWSGAWAHRTVAPLLPSGTGPRAVRQG
ncbi:MAG: mycofactocin biosynthesis glycosyltransferase MftF [Pseudonocardia sp.]|nr:mycofactocin biosynthesis glycosyltransferase MftF [Pseudonocardia sp.]